MNQYKFYRTPQWHKTSNSYRKHVFDICERCGTPTWRKNDKNYIRLKKQGEDVRFGIVHHEKVKDDMGMVFRTNPTAAKTDKYHHEGGYIGARKIFQCFMYNEWELKDIKHITGRP